MKGLVAGIIVIALLALLIPRGNDDEPEPRRPATAKAAVVTADGSLKSPKPGAMPVFSAADVSPGTIVDGTVTIANAGSRNGYFSLSQRGLLDKPGPAGGALSRQLRMEVRDVTRPAKPETLYDGPYARMDVRPVGFIEPGGTRRYRFVATVGRGAERALAGSSTSARYVWSVVEGTPAPARPAPPKDTRPPRLAVTVPRVQRLLTTPYLVARVSCSEDCLLTATGGLRRRLAAGRTAVLRIRIPRRRLRAFRRSLRAGRAAKLHVTISARDRAGNRAAARRTVRLKPRVR